MHEHHVWRRIVIFACWLGIAIMIVTAGIILVSTPVSGAPGVLAALVPVGFLFSVLHRLKPLPVAADPPLRCDCRSVTRGSGELTLATDGTLTFESWRMPKEDTVDPNESTLQRTARIGGRAVGGLALILGLVLVPTALVIELAGVLRLNIVLSIILGWGLPMVLVVLYWQHHQKMQASSQTQAPSLPDQSFVIPPGNLVAVVPYRRFLLGPSIVVGYRSDASKGLTWDEFLLSRTDSLVELATPTSDPGQWARLAKTPALPSEVAAAAGRFRAHIHRREAIAQWLVTTALLAVLLLSAFGGVGLLLGMPLFWSTVAGLITLVISAFVALLEVAAFH
jgi:hypothetical protein